MITEARSWCSVGETHDKFIKATAAEIFINNSGILRSSLFAISPLGAISFHRKERLPVYTVASTALLRTFHFLNIQINFCYIGGFIYENLVKQLCWTEPKDLSNHSGITSWSKAHAHCFVGCYSRKVTKISCKNVCSLDMTRRHFQRCKQG